MADAVDQQVTSETPATKHVAAGKLVAQRTKQACEAQKMLISVLKNPAMIQMVIRLLDEVPKQSSANAE